MSEDFDKLFEQEMQAEAAAPKQGKKAKKTKATGEPKVKVEKAPDGPNPYGIHNRRDEIITMTYLRKYAQCATRGMKGGNGTEFTREQNIEHFMSEDFLTSMAGCSTGEYSTACRTSERWGNEAYVPKPRKQREKKAKVAAQAMDESDILDWSADSPTDRPLY